MKWLTRLCILLAGFNASADDWKKLMDNRMQEGSAPIVTNRMVEKSQKWMIVGPAIGTADRADLYAHFPVSLAVRRYFSETSAWEWVRANYDIYSITQTARDVTASTGYVVDAQQAYWSLSTGYVYSPIYGKYAFSDSFSVHFDAYLGLSVGARFASSVQPYIEPSIGIYHYLTPFCFLQLPDIRTRFYSEKRNSGGTVVAEFITQVGVGWLF